MVKMDGVGVKVDQLYRMTTEDLNNLGYRDEPFILANDVAQVFYVKVICLKRIYNFGCSMLVYTPFALCFVTLRGVFMHFPELTY
jgi:hypothetical protein